MSTSQVQKRIEVERKIVTGLLEHLQKAGFQVKRTAGKVTNSIPTAVAEFEAIDGPVWVEFTGPSDGKAGQVLLIPGNGTDVLSDWTIPMDGMFNAVVGDYLDNVIARMEEIE